MIGLNNFMNQKKTKKLRKLFRSACDLKGIEDFRPKYNIKGQVVESNLWRVFKKGYKQDPSKIAL